MMVGSTVVPFSPNSSATSRQALVATELPESPVLDPVDAKDRPYTKCDLRRGQQEPLQPFCVNATNSACPFGTPNPVQAFHPGPAWYPVLLPLGMLFPCVTWRRRVGLA